MIYRYIDESLGQLLHDHLLVGLWRSDLKPLQLKKFLHKHGKLHFLELTLEMEFTWKMRRSIWYFRTCTGAPSVTVWKQFWIIQGFFTESYVNLYRVQQLYCQLVLSCQPVLCSTIVLSTCIVFFCRLIPIRLGFDSLPVLHKVGGRSGDVKGPEDSLAGPLLILFLPTWSWRVPSRPLVVRPLRCWSSWALLKVIIHLRQIWDSGCHVPQQIWRYFLWTLIIPSRLPGSFQSSYWCCPGWVGNKTSTYYIKHGLNPNIIVWT